jgi:carbon-monoxide dehydrogenase medium subunit
MTPFDMLEPTTLKEAIALLDPREEAVRPVAGGTALMLMMKAGVFQPTQLVSLQRIEADFSVIGVTDAGELRIGAMATLSQLEHDKHVASRYAVLARTLRTLSNVRIRNVARVGGALAHGDPHMDLPPVLAALGARVTVQGPSGTRDLPVEALYAGYYQTVLERNELIEAVTVPALEGRKAAYAKITARSADDWPSLGVAVSFALQDDKLRDPIVVVSAATEKLTRVAAAEKALQGAAPDDAALRRAGEAAVAEAAIIADAHGSSAFKKELLRVWLGRAVRQALGNAE